MAISPVPPTPREGGCYHLDEETGEYARDDLEAIPEIIEEPVVTDEGLPADEDSAK